MVTTNNKESSSISIQFNSETEISTDPEFDIEEAFYNRGIAAVKETKSSVAISNDSEIKKVSVKCTIIEQPKSSASIRGDNSTKTVSVSTIENDAKSKSLKFKPLITTSNESIDKISKRIQEQKPKAKAVPLVNPNYGDYLLSRTQSSGGNISSELKKKFFMGPSTFRSGIQKSGSVSSIIDSKLKSFKTNISEKQKLLNPANEISPSIKAFLETSSTKPFPFTSSITSNQFFTQADCDHEHQGSQPDLTKNINESNNDVARVPKIVSDNQIVIGGDENRNPSPNIDETVLIVPTIKWDQLKRNKCLQSHSNDIDSDSLSISSSASSSSSHSSISEMIIKRKQLEIPRVEIRNSKGDLMEDEILADSLNIDIVDVKEDKISKVKTEKKELNQPKTLPMTNYEILVNEESNSSELSSSAAATVTITGPEMSECLNDGLLKDLEVINGDRKSENNSEFTSHICDKQSVELSTSESFEFMDDKSDNITCSEKQEIVEETLSKNGNILDSRLSTKDKNTGYCIVDDDGYGAKVIDLSAEDLELKRRNTLMNLETEPDSLMIIDEPNEVVTATYVRNDSTPVTDDSTIKKIQKIHEERSKQSCLIHEMVMSKILSSGSGGSMRERRKRNRSINLSFVSPKSPMSVSSIDVDKNEDIIPLRKSQTEVEVPKVLTMTPSLSSVLNSTDIKSSRIKLREDARARVRLKSDQDLGLSPEEKLQLLKQRYRRTLNFDENATKEDGGDLKKGNTFKSDSNLFTSEDVNKNDDGINSATNTPKRTPKTKDRDRDRDRGKSLLQSLAEFFQKRKDNSSSPCVSAVSSPSKKESGTNSSSNSSSRDRFSMFRSSQKSKDKFKSYWSLEDGSYARCDMNLIGEKSVSDNSLDNTSDLVAVTNAAVVDNTDTSTQSPLLKTESRVRKSFKNSEMKRVRIAQNIQRQLEETEVEIRDLEKQGVILEQLIRGEISNESTVTAECNDTTKAFKEWFDVMRQLSDLKLHEKELIVQAKELELDDQHARLQQDLHDRLSRNIEKTKEDIIEEGKILNNMIEIVKQKDQLRHSLSLNVKNDCC